MVDSLACAKKYQLPSVDENQPLNRPFFYGNRHGSEDSLLDALNAVTVPPPQRKRPSAIYKVADEESPLLPYGGGDGGTPEDKARIVFVPKPINVGSTMLINFTGQLQFG